MSDNLSIPFVAGIIERVHEGKLQLLIQTRFSTKHQSIYNGTFEFVAGQLDKPFENIYESLRREIKEETGLTLKKIIDDDRTHTFNPQEIDASFGFKPFCCVQQLRGERAWVGFIFRCEVEDGAPADQETETKDVHWEDATRVKQLFFASQEKFFAVEVPAWHYYFKSVEIL